MIVALVVAAVLVVVNGAFVAVEFALLASRPSKLQALAESGNASAMRALDATKDLNLQLAGAQLGITVASLLLGFVGEPSVGHLVEDLIHPLGLGEATEATVGFAIGLAIVVFAHMVFGEMVPKNIALASPEKTLLFLTLPSQLYLVIAGPIVRFLNWVSRIIVQAMGIEPRDELLNAASAEEISSMVAASRDEGLIADVEHRLLTGALEIGDRATRAIMVDRDDVVTIPRSATPSDAEVVVTNSGHSRLVVVGDGLDDVLGFVHAKDLLTLDAQARRRPLPLGRIRPMPVVAVDRPIDEVLVVMQRAQVHMALVPRTRFHDRRCGDHGGHPRGAGRRHHRRERCRDPSPPPAPSDRPSRRCQAPGNPVTSPASRNCNDRHLCGYTALLIDMSSLFRRFSLLIALVLTVGLLAPATAQADEADVTRARDRADAATRALSDAETRLGELEDEIADLEAEAETARRYLAGLEDTVHDLAIQQFMTAGQTRLFTDGDINRQVTADALAEEVQQGNADTIDDFLAVQADLAETEAILDARLAEQAETVQSLKDRRAELAAELKKVEEAERKRKEEEARRKAEAERAAAAAAAARNQRVPATSGGGTSGGGTSGGAAAAPASVQVVSGGGMACPIAGATSFIDSWGFPRSGGRRHQGVDMFAARGTPVVAPVSGNLTHRGNRVGGLSFHLYGDNGTYYYGTHLNGYANQGAGHVSAGTVVGYVGDSGNARGSGTHLHFEIHPNGGSAVNPYGAVRAAC